MFLGIAFVPLDEAVDDEVVDDDDESSFDGAVLADLAALEKRLDWNAGSICNGSVSTRVRLTMTDIDETGIDDRMLFVVVAARETCNNRNISREI